MAVLGHTGKLLKCEKENMLRTDCPEKCAVNVSVRPQVWDQPQGGMVSSMARSLSGKQYLRVEHLPEVPISDAEYFDNIRKKMPPARKRKSCGQLLRIPPTCPPHRPI